MESTELPTEDLALIRFGDLQYSDDYFLTINTQSGRKFKYNLTAAIKEINFTTSIGEISYLVDRIFDQKFRFTERDRGSVSEGEIRDALRADFVQCLRYMKLKRAQATGTPATDLPPLRPSKTVLRTRVESTITDMEAFKAMVESLRGNKQREDDNSPAS